MGDFVLIIPLILIIPKIYMCVLEKLKKTKNEKNFLYWLKDLKCFIRFIIIASCNLEKSNKSDIYKPIQEKCLEPIAAGLLYMNTLISTTSICKAKAEKSLNSLLLLCFKLIKCQYKYENKHKKLLKLIMTGTNDLGSSALIQLFHE